MTVLGIDGKKRCFGGELGKKLYADYHDNEWGVASHDDQHLFEMLILEGAQAGLSWETILNKRQGYQAAFHNFDPKKVASMTERELLAQMSNPAIIRNRLKILSVKQNARVFLDIQRQFGSFDAYLWGFVNGQVKKTPRNSLKDIPTRSVESDALSKDLKGRGMNFVGSKIIYSYMQAVGLVDDHLVDCWRNQV